MSIFENEMKDLSPTLKAKSMLIMDEEQGPPEPIQTKSQLKSLQMKQIHQNKSRFESELKFMKNEMRDMKQMMKAVLSKLDDN